jgi:DNA primase
MRFIRQEWEVSLADTLYPDAKEQVRQATDIVDLIGKHLELRRAGRGYVGRCPWHDDRRPSLQVNPDRQTWKCWVCDIGGDVFSFVMKREGCDFREALKMLADRAGITLAGPQKKAAPGSPDDKNTLYQSSGSSSAVRPTNGRGCSIGRAARRIRRRCWKRSAS